MLRMENVSKTFNGKTYALDNVNLHIEPGEFVFLVGPSGAGKSTFIKSIFKEVIPDSGNIYVNGVNIDNLSREQIPGLRRKLGIVFQDYSLLPDRTAFENIAFAMQVVEAPKSKIKYRVDYVLNLVGLSDKANSFPEELSGGEQQRIAIARAVVNDPKLLIADEPTGNLDPETRWEIMDIFQAINKTKTTIIMATHDKNIVDTMHRRVIAIENGQIVRDQNRGFYGE